MPFSKENTYTTDYIYSLPEGQRAELIDGVIYDMAPPNRLHQELVMNLSAEIREYISKNYGFCKVYPAPFAVFLNKDDKTYVEPDISIICDKSKLDDRGYTGAPDWIIEIVSPASRRMDYYTKLFRYRTAGVREYWIVDPSKNQIIVYDFEHGDMEQFTFQDSIKAGIYEDLFIRLENVE